MEYQGQYRQGRHELETLEQRQLRLTLANRNTTARLNNETPEQRQHRLEQVRIAQTRRLRTFAPIVSAHPYCARNSLRDAMPRHALSARAIAEIWR